MDFTGKPSGHKPSDEMLYGDISNYILYLCVPLARGSNPRKSTNEGEK